MPLWLQIIIVASTFAGLLFAAFAIWFSFKEKQTQLGASVSELQDMVAAQQKTLAASTRRIQNLEAIVTSQVWDAVNPAGLPEAKTQRSLSQAPGALDLPEKEPSDADRAAQLARRLKT